jgi:hypothetical protein
MRSVVATIACLGLLACASTAQAAQRYAAPGGSGPQPCAQAAPCSLKEAIFKAKAGDEVIIGGGSYAVSEPLVPEGVPTNVYIHGDLGGPMPQIVGSGTPYTILLTGTGARLAYLDMSNKAPGANGAFCTAGGKIEGIRATAVGELAVGIQQGGDCTVRDSIARADGTNSTAINVPGAFGSSNMAVARNVTAIASGTNSRGIHVSCVPCFPFESVTLDMKNTIVSGSSSDLEVSGGSSSARIIVANSNFDVAKAEGESIVNQGGNQNAPPLFVDAANGDYREAAASPTIDAGAVDPQTGALDPDGNPRTVGSAPDIGAYEFVPPPVPPGQIQSLSLAPTTFRVVNAGEAIFSAKKKMKAPVGTTVAYSLSGKATTEFFVERRAPGRKVKGKCKPVTKANRAKKKCAFFRLNKTGFAHSGATGNNTFKFSGRIGGKGLAPGSYRLVASAGGTGRTTNFKIVK